MFLALLLLAALQSADSSVVVASGVAIARDNQGSVVDSVVYAIHRPDGSEGGVWISVQREGEEAFDLPSATVAALEASLDYHLAARDPQESMGVMVSDGDLRVVFERSVPFLLLGVGLATVVALSVLALWLVRERRRTSLLTLVTRHQTESREQERLHIAREIHDGPVQAITAAVHALARTGGDPGTAERIREAAAELRGIASGLRPPALDRFGLSVALVDLAERIEEAHPGVRVALDRPPSLNERDVPSDVGLAVYRVAQEASQNAVTHGAAKHLRISLRADADGLTLSVADDGKGMASAAPSFSALVQTGHFGLVGMEERARSIGGRLRFDSSPAGTTVTLRVPLKVNARLAPA